MRDLGFTYLLHADKELAYVGTRPLPCLLNDATQLVILDIRAPDRPLRLGSVTIPRMSCFTIRGRYAYAGRRGAMDIVDLADPRQPEVVGSFPLSRPHHGSYAARIEVRGDLAVVAAREAGMLVLDIATPVVPKLVSAYFPPSRFEVINGRTREYTGYVSNLALGTSHIYVGRLGGALYILDLATSAHLREVGSQLLGTAHVLEVRGQSAYVATRGSEDRPDPFYVLDLSIPTEPRVVHMHDTPDLMSDLCFSGNMAFTIGGMPREAGLHVAPGALHAWDLADAHRPIHLGVYPLSAWKVAVGDRLLYLADADGLRIFALRSGS